MRIFFTIILLKVISVCLVTFIIFELSKGHLNAPLQYALEYYLKLKNIDAKVNNLLVKDGLTTIDSIIINKDGATIKLKDILIKSHLDIEYREYKRSKFSADVEVDKILLLSKNNEELFTSKANIFYENLFFKRKSSWRVNASNDTDTNLINDKFAINIFYSSASGQKAYDIKAKLSDDSFLNLQGKVDQNIIFSGSAQNIPISIYKPAYYLDPSNETLIFLNEFIKNGNIESADFNVSISEQEIKENKFNNSSITGFAKINDLEFLYHEDLPSLTKMQIEVSQNGLTTEFKINSANSTDIAIKNALVKMDWKGVNDTIVFVTAKGHGLVSALIDLIPIGVQNKLQQSNIDLKKFTGLVNIDIKIDIPLKSDAKNNFNITANIPNTSLSIFKEMVQLKRASLFAKFAGDYLEIKGKGLINNFESEIGYYQNFVDKSQFENKLNIISHLVAGKDHSAKQFTFITIKEGNAKLDFEYLTANNDSKFSAKSDLKNLSFYFDKLGIHKNQGVEAMFNLEGKMNTSSSGNIDFLLRGENSLNIGGKIDVGHNTTNIAIDSIKSNNTNLSSHISINKDFIDIKLRGKVLDLSNAEMLQFLEKERDSGATNMSASIERVKLKNDIWLDNLKLKFRCDKIKCFEGFIDASIGSKTVELLLTEENNLETWLIKSSNAGAILRGLGAYNDMRAGNMMIKLRANRKEVKAGEFISVVIGNFVFDRFVLHDAPSLSKLVSVVSLPGFVNLIRGNRDIIFSHMTGDFKFQRGILHIENSSAVGPFFNFTMAGKVNTLDHTMVLKGHVNPSLYGASSVIGAIPIIGRIFTGDTKHRGLMSAPYVLRENY